MDSLGDRMKSYYEDRFRQSLPRRTYTVIRLDGKAFHTLTKQFGRPFDDNFIHMMDETAIYLCENIQGVKIAYVQSDEITLVLIDFDSLQTESWFDGNIQKITSVSAALATSAFNKQYFKYQFYCVWNENLRTDNTESAEFFDTLTLAQFDSRVFVIPEHEEVKNCLVWRQQDAIRNSVQMVAQSLFTHQELHKKSIKNQLDMILQKGQNWNDYPDYQKRGRIIVKESYECTINTNEENLIINKTHWVCHDAPTLSSEEGQELLNKLIPNICKNVSSIEGK
jgi:tRNA(His) 5'-end guanylyltransferase